MITFTLPLWTSPESAAHARELSYEMALQAGVGTAKLPIRATVSLPANKVPIACVDAIIRGIRNATGAEPPTPVKVRILSHFRGPAHVRVEVESL